MKNARSYSKEKNKKMIAVVVVLIIAFVGTITMANEKATKSVKAEDCQPWEDFKNGKCEDKPGVFRPGEEYHQPGNVRCFADCLCGKDQYPSGPSCAPCKYDGKVCMPR